MQTTQILKMSQSNPVRNDHNERQAITVQNAAKVLLLLQAPIYEENEITNKMFSS